MAGKRYYLVFDKDEGIVIVRADDEVEAIDLAYYSPFYGTNVLSGILQAQRLPLGEAREILKRDSRFDLEQGEVRPVLRPAVSGGSVDNG